MASKEEFKEFVKDHPRLIGHVKNGDMNWQKFYELYDLYGESGDIWEEYLKEPTVESKSEAATKAAVTGFSVGEIMNFLKGIDLDELQNGVSSLQRVVGVLQDFGKKETPSPKEQYKPRPIYKHFED